MSPVPALSIAVVGAGLAGAACARALSAAGHGVQVFDKARGAGGRLATRRTTWLDAAGREWTTRLDHGALAITAHSSAFQDFVAQAVRAGWLAEWTPRLAGHGLPLEDDARQLLPVPDMPALCRHLLGTTPAHWSMPVEHLHRGPRGWELDAAGARHGTPFDAVVLAVPPAQAAPLIGPHRSDWARHAALAPMQPCWTLMGVAADTDTDPPWDLARPSTGPLAWVLRSDTRPGRARVPGQAHWVLHARSAWSRRHLELGPQEVQPLLQAALEEVLGRPVDWLQVAVHRWRYALPQPHPHAPDAPPAWWDASLGLGVCGDFLGGSGAEGAWLSAQALCAAMTQDTPHG